MAAESQAQPDLYLWPYEEAKKVAERVKVYQPDRPVIFESGFGPSGLPHLGTISEVLRPFFVRRAFERLGAARLTRLIVFIDDMDGLRKVPENIPGREALGRHLGKPVSQIPDPFADCHLSFSEHMVDLLGKFLAPVEVEYELLRASEMYASGRFNQALEMVVLRHEDIIQVIAPTLRAENRAGWSPIMPRCPNCGQINSTRVTAYHPQRAAVGFSCERDFGGAHGCGYRGEQTALDGKAKVQWKVDWALRWYVLKVDYELYGKDLIDSARLSGQIVRLLGGEPPIGFAYEMFLDEQGHKVSKSVGRGVTVGQWTRYAPIEVLKYFLLLNPRRARRLFVEAIPQYVDEYLEALRAYAQAPAQERSRSPLEFVFGSESARQFNSDLSFTMIMNLVPALGTSDFELIQNYLIRSYHANIEGDRDTTTMVAKLISCALNYYSDFVAPAKKPYVPSDNEREQLLAFKEFLDKNPNAGAEEIDKAIYDLGRAHYDKPGRIFSLFYRVILSQERGPRLGAFIRLATPPRVAGIIEAALQL